MAKDLIDDTLEVRELIIDNSVAICFINELRFCSVAIDAVNSSYWGMTYFTGIGAFIHEKDGNGGQMSFYGTGIGIKKDDIQSPAVAAAVLALQAYSDNAGFLPPVMTAAQKNGIANTQGLLIYSSDGAKLCINTGAGWQTITSV